MYMYVCKYVSKYVCIFIYYLFIFVIHANADDPRHFLKEFFKQDLAKGI